VFGSSASRSLRKRLMSFSASSSRVEAITPKPQITGIASAYAIGFFQPCGRLSKLGVRGLLYENGKSLWRSDRFRLVCQKCHHFGDKITKKSDNKHISSSFRA
jgi:5-methylcytosine-specific restriction endonuclease McrA